MLSAFLSAEIKRLRRALGIKQPADEKRAATRKRVARFRDRKRGRR